MFLGGQRGYTADLRPLLEESLSLFRATGESGQDANPMMSLGRVAMRAGDLVAARAWFEQALARRRQTGDQFLVAHSLAALGDLARREGHHDEAIARLSEGLDLFRQLGARHAVDICLVGLGAVSAAAGQPPRAARLLAAAEALRESTGAVLPLIDAHDYAQLVAGIRAALGEDLFARTWAAGRALALEQVIDMALTATEPAAVPRLPAPGAPASADPGVLTPRQVEYLRLIAAGRTNREIAGELVVSENAVEQMLVKLYDLIGARNRAEAIRYALEHRLATPVVSRPLRVPVASPPEPGPGSTQGFLE
jgi:DNA-binding NarL/FixJ family response regulator